MSLKSLIFSEEEIVGSPNYTDAVKVEAFMQRVRKMCVYEQDYVGTEVVELKQAEEILIAIKKIVEK